MLAKRESRQSFLLNLILGVTLAFAVWFTVFLTRLGAWQTSDFLYKVAMVGAVVLAISVVWWIIHLISSDVSVVDRQHIVTALPLLVGLGVSAYYCLWVYEYEGILLAGAFLITLFTAQVSATSQDCFRQHPRLKDQAAVFLFFSLLPGILLLLLSWIRFRTLMPFHLLVAVMILILALYEYINRLMGNVQTPVAAVAPHRPMREHGDSLGQTTLLIIDRMVSTMLSMGSRSYLLVFGAFVVFYISVLHVHTSGGRLGETVSVFYDLSTQVLGIILAVVVGFGALTLERAKDSPGAGFLLNALRRFVGIYTSALLLFLAGTLLCSAIDSGQVQEWLDINQPWQVRHAVGILLFEASCLTVPLLLIFLQGFLSVFVSRHDTGDSKEARL